MKLVIVESPKKSVTIGEVLGPDYKVVGCEGHIRDLSTHGKGGLGIEIENGFKPSWEIPAKKKAIVSKLVAEAKKADEVILATDPDREGEAISWHLASVLKLPISTTKRVRFHEITKDVIPEAFASPSTIDMNLVEAQETRRLEDRIIGFQVSSLLQRKIGLQSAGRVQSATLRMIVDRQAEIEAFVPEEYWVIDVQIDIGGASYKATLTEIDGEKAKISSKEEAEAILARIPKELLVASVKKEAKKINPPLPFTTSSMQQAAFNKYRFSNSTPQSVAQKLYEGEEINGEHVGLITYMRTDSSRISPAFYNRHAVPFIEETWGKEYVGSLRQPKNKAGVQDAHEAIRPTGTHRTPEAMGKFLSSDEAKLYRLIYCRALASLMAPKRIETTSVALQGNGLTFSLSGTKTLFKGYEAVYQEFDDEEISSLPDIQEGACFAVSGVNPQQKFTKPEPPYNEASIVKEMFDRGIGRPSTYATTIETIIKRKYVTATRGVLTPTEEGKKAVSTRQQYFPDIVSIDYTASMESELDEVEKGQKTFLQAMNDFYVPFEKNFQDAKAKMQKEPDEPTGELCPECGHPLVVKRSRKGSTFIGCSNYPACHYIKREEKEPDVPVGENCPECGKPLVYKTNKKGEKFIGCSGFPSCRYTRSVDGKVTVKKVYTEADYVKPCPKCKTGHLVIKQGKKKPFLACTNFPKCHYHEWIDEKKEK